MALGNRRPRYLVAIRYLVLLKSIRRCNSCKPASSGRWRTRDRIRRWLPDVPTFAELGYPEFTSKVWFGLLVKEGVPADILKRLTDAAVAAHADPEICSKLEAQGFEVSGETGPQLLPNIKDQIKRWGRLANASGFSAEDRGNTR